MLQKLFLIFFYKVVAHMRVLHLSGTIQSDHGAASRVYDLHATVQIREADEIRTGLHQCHKLALLVFSLLAPGDVLNQSDKVIHRTIGAPQTFCRHGRVNHRAIFSNPTLVQCVAIDLAVKHPVELAEVAGQVVGMRYFWPGLLEQLVALVAQDAAQLVVHLKDFFAWRSDRHADQSQFKVTAESFLAFSQGLFDSLAVGNVPEKYSE